MEQVRLWVTEPERRTCVAEVLEVRGFWFLVDRALFAPTSKSYHHPQPPDRGVVWVEGSKRRLGAIQDRGQIWYRLQEGKPEVGQSLNCQLDQDRRDESSLAHTAMHLWLHACRMDMPPMLRPPEVRGGGYVRFEYAWPIPREILGETLRRVWRFIEDDMPLRRSHLAWDDAQHDLKLQVFETEMVWPEVLPLVYLGDQAPPCDGTHVDRTGRLQKVEISHARMGKAGFVVGLRVR